MERRKDTAGACAKLPRDYLRLIEDVFNKNFSKQLLGSAGKRERFLLFAEIYPDELVMSVSLKNPETLRMTTCYASVEYPPPQTRSETGQVSTAAETVEIAVNQCVDAVASFFATYFDEDRPVDYDLEYRQNWTPIDLDKTTRVYLKINRDNTELDAEADTILQTVEPSKKDKKKLH